MSNQYEKGHLPDLKLQSWPGLQYKMDPQPATTELPSKEGGYKTYRAAGKLEGSKALITGGDSGIGRATAVLFAMEGADCAIVYLPEEEKDAQETKRLVEEKGRKCFLMQADLSKMEEAKRVVDEAVQALGGLSILVNNAAYQMVCDSILDLPE